MRRFTHREPITPTAEAIRISASLVVDGRLDEPVWETATAITEFRQQEPSEGEISTEPTDVRIVYDDTHLYKPRPRGNVIRQLEFTPTNVAYYNDSGRLLSRNTRLPIAAPFQSGDRLELDVANVAEVTFLAGFGSGLRLDRPTREGVHINAKSL